jgi:two-component system phosphate regulon response regulator PhoB
VVQSITFRYRDLFEMRLALMAAGRARCLVVPNGAAVRAWEWALVDFEVDAEGRATVAAGRVVTAGDTLCVEFERRDWERLSEFATPWDQRPTDPGIPPPPSFPSMSHEGSHALVVEDQRASRKMITIFLSALGLTVRATASAEQALEVLEGQSFDLVVLNLGLPGMSGLALCKELRRRPDTATVPILILTGNASEKYERYALRAGANDYVTKPVPQPEFRARVLALVRRGRPSQHDK